MIIIIIIIFLFFFLFLIFKEEEILLATMLTIKILFTINSLKKKKKLFNSKTLFTIPVELKST